MSQKFLNITYLSEGNPIQRQALSTIQTYKLWDILEPFDPVLAGTIPIEINVSNSDLDVLCCASDLELFGTLMYESFSEMPDFKMNKGTIRQEPFVLCTFQTSHFPIEIFAQHIPIKQQFAFRHLLIEHYLLEKYGSDFKARIIALKEQGVKTEPAFAQLLGLDGDPYMALLQFEGEMNKK